jgi:hypothetical protein
MTDTIRAAAHATVGARQKTASTARTLAEAQSVSDGLKARVTALETERASIIANARGGDSDPKHALRLCVLEADLKDMKPMTDDANAGVAVAHSHDLEARQASSVLSSKCRWRQTQNSSGAWRSTLASLRLC